MKQLRRLDVRCLRLLFLGKRFNMYVTCYNKRYTADLMALFYLVRLSMPLKTFQRSSVLLLSSVC